jgi:hypothetical protein
MGDRNNRAIKFKIIIKYNMNKQKRVREKQISLYEKGFVELSKEDWQDRGNGIMGIQNLVGGFISIMIAGAVLQISSQAIDSLDKATDTQKIKEKK